MICPYCGEQVNMKSASCKHCGNAMNLAEQMNSFPALPQIDGLPENRSSDKQTLGAEEQQSLVSPQTSRKPIRMLLNKAKTGIQRIYKKTNCD